jgi:hypothetical protein
MSGNSHQRQLIAAAVSRELAKQGRVESAAPAAKVNAKDERPQERQKGFSAYINLLRSMGDGSFLLGSRDILQMNFWIGFSFISAGFLSSWAISCSSHRSEADHCSEVPPC